MINHIAIISLVVAATLSPAPVLADDVNGAATAFSQAQEAMLAGDPARAADLYELADSLAPSAAALRNAARARLAAKHEAMAATLAAELLSRYPSDVEARELAESILSKLSPQLAQLDVTCSEACTLTIDSRAINGKPSTHHTFFARPGPRTVGGSFDGDRQTSQQINALAGQTTTLSLEAPAKVVKVEPKPTAGSIHEADRHTEESHGVGRKWIVLTGILTVGLGASTIVEGLSTLDQRDDIQAAVAARDSAKAMSLYNDARSTQLRTNILIGATAAAGLSTIILAFVTNWSPDKTTISLAPTSGGAALAFGGSF
jgi:hypothetical protein